MRTPCSNTGAMRSPHKLILRLITTMNDLLSPVNAAKAMGLVLLVHGTFHTLAPGPTASRYGVPGNERNEYNQCIRRIGCSLLATCALVWSLVVQGDDDLNKAYALSVMIWAIEMLGAILNKESSTQGNSDVPDMVVLAIQVLLLFALFNETLAPLARKTTIAMTLFFALGFTILPKQTCVQVYQSNPQQFEDKERRSHIIFLVRVAGFGMLQGGAFLVLLENNFEPVRAFGFSCSVLVLGLLSIIANIHEVSFAISVRHIAMASGCMVLMFLMLRDESSKAADEAE